MLTATDITFPTCVDKELTGLKFLDRNWAGYCGITLRKAQFMLSETYYRDLTSLSMATMQ